MKQFKNQIVNVALTTRLAKLHEMGYCNDYAVTAECGIICIQNDSCCDYNQAIIQLVDHIYDQAGKRFCYLHTVETQSGDKGILLLQSFFPKPLRREKRAIRMLDAFYEVL